MAAFVFLLFWVQHPFLGKPKSLVKIAPLTDAARRSTTVAPEPRLAPSVSGQEGKGGEVDSKPVAVVGAAEPEEIKSGTTAAPEPLLAPSDSGQEVEEEEVEKESVAVGKVMPEEIKSGTTPEPEPLLAPSDSGQEVEEKEVEKEPVAVGKVMPERIKSVSNSFGWHCLCCQSELQVPEQTMLAIHG
ncbi:uncharacterized protein LOC113980701 isoform X3 [Neopelma chrysocephalum]|uniref:uncharacterized protein LOC113980701 isoform X3 n=1 Tax=Neopelma chrysocephalum TaxID=114329 RepID=UPI000FCD4331|nr:uncharacterized protein LOC113980701 isoform X3 [Neopelma chrysocephalum]